MEKLFVVDDTHHSIDIDKLQPRGFELKNCYICTKCGWMDSEKSKTCPCCGERLED